MIFFFVASNAQAAELTEGSVTISDPTAGQTGVTYSLRVSNQSTSLIRCIEVRFTETPGSNAKPDGMNISSTVFDNASTIIPTPASWSINNNNSTGVIRLTNASGELPAGGSGRTITFTNIGNGSSSDIAYYAEIATYSDTGCSSAVDTDGLGVFNYTNAVLVRASVPLSLTLSADTGCSLGVLAVDQVASCSHALAASTNNPGGYTLSYSAPSTLSQEQDQDAVTQIGGSAMPSMIGTRQFGFNLVANTVPSVGGDPVGGSGVVKAQYNTANAFAFLFTGAPIAESTGSTSTTTFTASYIANIAPGMVAGAYTTHVTYTAIPNP